jgi:hypothetical protein
LPSNNHTSTSITINNNNKKKTFSSTCKTDAEFYKSNDKNNKDDDNNGDNEHKTKYYTPNFYRNSTGGFKKIHRIKIEKIVALVVVVVAVVEVNNHMIQNIILKWKIIHYLIMVHRRLFSMMFSCRMNSNSSIYLNQVLNEVKVGHTA